MQDPSQNVTPPIDPDQDQGKSYNAEAMIPRLQWAAALGVFFILLYALQFRPIGDGLRVAATGTVVASAAMMFGVLFGFIFCIPRLVKRTESAANPTAPTSTPPTAPPTTTSMGTVPLSAQTLPVAVATPTQSATQFDDNSNLVDISDWLTKILVGAGLVELNKLPVKVWALAGALSNGLRVCDSAHCIYSSQVFALAILFTYGPLGFMVGYLWTRLYYQPTLSNLRRNNKALRSTVQNLVQQNSFQSDLNMSITSRELSNLDEALSYIDKALALEPDNGRALFEKARILRRMALRNVAAPDQGLLGEAMGYAIQAAQRMPKPSSAFYNIACYQNLLNYPPSAVLSNLGKAISLNPDLKQIALGDADFASLRNNADFQTLVASDAVSTPIPKPNPTQPNADPQDPASPATSAQTTESNPPVGGGQ